jgi:uncharacterized repeat protein (TIGR01451 family)
MKHVFNIFITISITLGGLFLFALPSYAQTPSCRPVYNGGPACVQHKDISINKEVREPGANQFRDNLTANSNTFSADSPIVFRITIKNTSNNTLSNITVTDTLSPYLTYTKGDGAFDKSSRTFSAKLNSLNKGQSKSFTISAAIVSQNQLPETSGSYCLSNSANVQTGDKRSTDIATYCIADESKILSAPSRGLQPTAGGTSKGGMPIYTQPSPTQTPGTGPETLPIVSLLASAAGGFLLRGKTTKK